MSETDLENMFSPDDSVDLYLDVVRSKTEWPTYDYSIKTLATYLGFKWRDKEPSGAASIEWYHRWVESGDTTIRQRILDYNEDDCIAMRVLLGAVQDLLSITTIF
jgi:predicted RecB family nuclease